MEKRGKITRGCADDKASGMTKVIKTRSAPSIVSLKAYEWIDLTESKRIQVMSRLQEMYTMAVIDAKTPITNCPNP